MLLRLAQIILPGLFGLYVTLIVFGNLTDYHTNFLFVQHVMSMDSIFEGSSLTYRAVTAPAVHHVVYVGIIVFEMFIAIACLSGALQMSRALKIDAASFHAAKRWAVTGFLVAFVLWFGAFQVVAGEWFAMWQSTDWNGLSAASRLTTIILMSLLALMIKD